MFCSDPVSGSHFIMQTSKFLLIDATAVTLGQGDGGVSQYISTDPYILCAKYVRFSSNGFDVRGKSCCRGGHGWNIKSRHTGLTLILISRSMISPFQICTTKISHWVCAENLTLKEWAADMLGACVGWYTGMEVIDCILNVLPGVLCKLHRC